MQRTLCDMCEEAEPEGRCKLCKAEICEHFDCSAYTKKHGFICAMCRDDLPIGDFTAEERERYGITE